MSQKKITGTGVITPADYKEVSWTGKTKSGSAVKIVLKDAINLGDLEIEMKDKNDSVAELTFTATSEAGTTVEPFEIIHDGTLTGGLDEIMLGAGVFSIGNVQVAATKGGGKFVRKLETRQIEIDGAFNPLKNGYIVEGSTVTLTVNAATFLVNMKDMFVGLSETTVTE